MSEKFENSSHENIGKNIDTLDKSINDLDNKVTDREDFSKYTQEFENIYNSFKEIENQVDTITDPEKKELITKQLEALKIAMLDLISDGGIDNFIKGETKDAFVNKQINDIDKIFQEDMNSLIQNLELGKGKLADVLNDTDPISFERYREIVQSMNLPNGMVQIGNNICPWFMISGSNEIYVYDNGKFLQCEGTSDSNNTEGSGESSTPKKSKSSNNGPKISYSEKYTKASIDNPLQQQKTVKLTQNLGSFSTYAALKTEGVGATPEFAMTWKGLKHKFGDSQFQAIYSPGKFAGEGGWTPKEVAKLKFTNNIKFKNGIKLSISEILKMNLAKFKKEFQTDVKASWNISSNITANANATINKKGLDFIGGGVGIRL